MSKIGIITYHNNRNRGSILQAYSLYEKLKEFDSENKIEIIDYRLFSEEISRLWTLNFKKFISKCLDFYTFERFLYDRNTLSKERVITNDHKKGIDFINEQNYDLLLIGSDTVWRLEKGMFSRPFPNAYFSDPKLNCLKATYAASSSLTDYKNLSRKEINLLKKHLSTLDKISVRDEHTENFLEKLGINEYHRVPDPTILINLRQKDLTDVLEKNGVSVDKPILNINQCGKIGKHIANHYRDKGYQIVSLYKSKYSDYDLWGKITPLEYYSIHDHFDFVVSGSLHSTIFSIKNNTPFATLDSSPEHLIDKKESLLEDFSLLNRLIRVSEKDSNEEILKEIERCENKFNKKVVKDRTKKLRKKGLNYLKKLEEILKH